VALIVLAHAPKVTVPRLVGARFAGAASTLLHLKLCLAVERRAGTSTPPLRVLAQSPAAGAKLKSWSTVTIALADTPLPGLALPVPDNDPCPRIASTVVRR
jgi:beta-lactam-binding protein with PASTA domain